MGATNFRHNAWLLLIATFLLSHSGFAFDKIESDNHLNALLDSAEILKLKGFYSEAQEVCKDIGENSLKSSQWESYARSLVEQADILRFSYYYSQDTSEINQALRLMDKAKKSLQQHKERGSIASIRYNIYMGKIYKFSESAKKNSTDSLLIYLEQAKDIADRNQPRNYELAKVNYELANYYC